MCTHTRTQTPISLVCSPEGNPATEEQPDSRRHRSLAFSWLSSPRFSDKGHKVIAYMKALLIRSLISYTARMSRCFEPNLFSAADSEMQSSEACPFAYSISLLDLLTTLRETGDSKLVSIMKYVAAVENGLAEAVLILGLNSFRVLPRDFWYCWESFR